MVVSGAEPAVEVRTAAAGAPQLFLLLAYVNPVWQGAGWSDEKRMREQLQRQVQLETTLVETSAERYREMGACKLVHN